MESDAKPFFGAAKIYFKDLVTYIESNRGFDGFTFKMMKTDFTQQKVLHDMTERLETGKREEGQPPENAKLKQPKKGFSFKSPFAQ